MRVLYWFLSVLVVASGVLLPACFNKSKNGPSADAGPFPDVLAPGVNIGDAGTKRYTVGGTVDGLHGTGLVLYGQGPALMYGGKTYTLAEPLAVAPGNNGASVSFTFQTAVPPGFPYTISVQTQPTKPAQNCMVAMGGSGKVGNGNVHNVVVNCSTDSFVVGGNVTGVQGSEKVVLEDNGGDSITVNGNTSFAFPHAIPSGGTYAVTVLGSPQFPAETCSVSMGSGTVTTAAISNVLVKCSPNAYNIGGTVVGLTGTGLVLTDNASDNLSITANGSFTFPMMVSSGATFAVAISTQPSGQVCVPSGNNGQVVSSPVTSVVINCQTNTFTVGGQVNGLVGSGLVLQNTNGPLDVGGDGAFAFPPQTDGSSYGVQVSSPPTNPSQTCTINGGSGTISGSNVNDVQVTCATANFSVGGQVSGLLPGSTVVVANNGGDDVMVNGNLSFLFPTQLSSGAGYNVTVATQPASGGGDGGSAAQQCDVTGGNGVVSTSDVSVQVVCTPVYTITVSVSLGTSGEDLGGDTLTLSDGVDTIPLNGGTPPVTFPTALPPGSYTVTATVTGACGNVICEFCPDGCSGTSTTATVGPNQTLSVQCTGDTSCCDNPCANVNCPNACTACGNEFTACTQCGGSGCG